MIYTLRRGALCRGQEGEVLCRIRRSLSEEKQIEDAAGCFCLDIRRIQSCQKNGDVRFHRYVMLDANGEELVSASPDYAKGEEPECNGWPLSRMPRVDRATMRWREQRYHMRICAHGICVIADCFGKEAVRFEHRGIMGGWNVSARTAFPPSLLCGLFVFFRYLEKENEMILI